MLRRLLFASLWLVAFRQATASETTPTGGSSAYAQVDVASTKTSIYIGTVSMTMPTFVRRGDNYETQYTAKVFPYFFYNEKGSLTVKITDAQLDQLAHGQTITFTGRGVRDDGTPRPVEGKATPIDAKSGKLKVHVAVSKRVDLIFNTTYRFRE